MPQIKIYKTKKWSQYYIFTFKLKIAIFVSMSLVKVVVKKFGGLDPASQREMRDQGLNPESAEDRSTYKKQTESITPIVASTESGQVHKHTTKVIRYNEGDELHLPVA